MILRSFAPENYLVFFWNTPFSGCLLVILNPLLSSLHFRYVSILFETHHSDSCLSLLVRFFSYRFFWDFLSSLLRFVLNNRLAQLAFSLFVKFEICVSAPYLALVVVWFCLSMVYSILLFQAVAKSDIVFLTISKTLFTLMGVYFRLRMSFFNIAWA